MLEDLNRKIHDLELNIKEIKEAIAAGNSAQIALEKVIKSLESAKGWGIWDMFGGGFLVTAAKHSKLDKAKEQAQHAQRMLSVFNRELSDINLPTDINIEIGSFVTFADYFLDGLMADWFVQGKIRDSLDKANDTYDRVNKILNTLQSRLMELNKELDVLKKR